MASAVATYEPRDPSRTVLYKVVADHLETFLAALNADPDATGLPAYVQREFYDYVQCGILAHGFLRLGCDTCQKELLLPFSCKRRGFCPSCAGRRMAQTAAHVFCFAEADLIECVSPATVSAEGVGRPFPLPPDTQLNGRPSPGCRHGNGSSPCPCPGDTGWRRHRT
jgi:Transposase zinc-binding domain